LEFPKKAVQNWDELTNSVRGFAQLWRLILELPNPAGKAVRWSAACKIDA